METEFKTGLALAKVSKAEPLLQIQHFAFWRGSVAVPAASSVGVSPFEATWGGTPLELAGEDATALRQN